MINDDTRHAFYIIDRKTDDYLRYEGGERVTISLRTKRFYEALNIKDTKFELIPFADPERTIATYEGGVNIGD